MGYGVGLHRSVGSCLCLYTLPHNHTKVNNNNNSYSLSMQLDVEDWAELRRYKEDDPGGLTPIGVVPLVGTTERRRHFLEWAFYEKGTFENKLFQEC